MVRIIATAAGHTLTYDPPQAGAPTTIANAGDFVEIPRQAASFMISADHKILVAQIHGGPIARRQHRRSGDGARGAGRRSSAPSYLFHAPTNYDDQLRRRHRAGGRDRDARRHCRSPASRRSARPAWRRRAGHAARQRARRRRQPLDHRARPRSASRSTATASTPATGTRAASTCATSSSSSGRRSQLFLGAEADQGVDHRALLGRQPLRGADDIDEADFVQRPEERQLRGRRRRFAREPDIPVPPPVALSAYVTGAPS